MAQRRILPQRKSRGMKTRQLPSSDVYDYNIDEQLLERVNEDNKNQVSTPINKLAYSTYKIADYKINLSLNKIKYPYCRSYHYFFNLDDFPRLKGHPSYAEDKYNVFSSTYNQSKEKIKKQPLDRLLNRKYIGLPMTSGEGRIQKKPKNICENYLFQNENKKYSLDRTLIQLKYILKNLSILKKNGKINEFSSIRKDSDLAKILEGKISIKRQKQLLEIKIQVLREKKDNMKIILLNEDNLYFYHSLNQKMHEQISSLENSLSLEKIIMDLSKSDEIRRQIASLKVHKHKIKPLRDIFSYHQSESNCLSAVKISKLAEKAGQELYRLDRNDNFCLVIPTKFFCFSNTRLLEYAEKVLVCRLVNMNESSFYVGKFLWKKIFNRNLNVSKQIKPIVGFEFDKLFSSSFNQMTKWLNKKTDQTEETICPVLDKLIQNSSLNVDKKAKKYLMKHEKPISLNPRQYACLIYFHQIYTCLGEIQKFVEKNKSFLDILGSENFNKIYHAFVEITQKPLLGILDFALKKLTEFIIRIDLDSMYTIKWEYFEEEGVGIAWKEVLDETETQKSEENIKLQKKIVYKK